MEAHHEKVERKQFTEYLLEGLMVFLAVTMGFFAENIRESLSDRQHIKQLTFSLAAELKHDTTNLNGLIGITRQRQKNIDSVFVLLQQPINNIDTYKLQILLIQASIITLYSPENGTITQLKNSGSLRLMGETKVPHYIGSLEGSRGVIAQLEHEDALNKAKYILEFERQHFTAGNLFAISNAAVQSRSQILLPEKKRMDGITSENLQQLSKDLMICKQNSGYLAGYYNFEKSVCADFIKYLQQEYHK